jgi:hypothetical protein
MLFSLWHFVLVSFRPCVIQSEAKNPGSFLTSPLGRGRAATLVSLTGEGARIDLDADALTRAQRRVLSRGRGSGRKKDAGETALPIFRLVC